MNHITCLADAALAFAELGIEVFPCKPNSKAPATPNGFKDATADVARVAKWWAAHPDCNIAAPCGIDFDVLDFDSVDLFHQGLTIWDEFFETPMVRTRKGGHVFVAPTGFPRKIGVYPKVDYLGSGGYVILPPSRGEDGAISHQWFGDGSLVALVPLPDELRARMEELLAPKVTEPSEPVSIATTDRYVAAAFRAELNYIANAATGMRNTVLNTAAYSLGQLVGAGQLTEAEVVGALKAAVVSWKNEAKDAKVIAFGIKAGKAEPRKMLT